MMRMAAIYARVSSEQQREENTIASQTASLIEFAESHDLEVPKEWVFEDAGYSGATLERPGEVPHALQAWPFQRRSAIPCIFEDPLFGHLQIVALGELDQRRRLARNRVLQIGRASRSE